MTCKRCIDRGQTWDGDPPKCAFESGVFSSDNWNCATMNELREWALKRHGSDWGGGAVVDDEDQHAGLLATGWGSFIVLGWYKNRGRTESAWFMDDDRMEPLTSALAEAVLENDPRPAAGKLEAWIVRDGRRVRDPEQDVDVDEALRGEKK